MERKEEFTRWFKGAIFRFNFSLRLSYRLATGSWQPFQERVLHEMCFVETVVSPWRNFSVFPQDEKHVQCGI